jgi:hypothetical protein
MISGVFFVLLGEAILAASLTLLGWFVAFVVLNAVYIPLAEEPGMNEAFWRRLPGLQAECATLDSPDEAVDWRGAGAALQKR